MALTEKQHAKAAELSADVLQRRRDLDAMEAAIDDLAEKLDMARDCKIKAAVEYQGQLAALNALLVQQ
jgi:uncharacterized coiled-coil protein SlyX